MKTLISKNKSSHGKDQHLHKKAPKKPFKGLAKEQEESGLSKAEFYKKKFKKRKKDDHDAFFSEKTQKKPRASLSASPLQKGMFVHVRIKEILSDTGNIYLSALGNYQGKDIFIERVPDTISTDQTVVVKLGARQKKLWMGDYIRLLRDETQLLGFFDAKTKMIFPIHRKKDFTPIPCTASLPDQMVVVFEEKEGAALIKEEIGLITSPKSYSKVAAFNQGVWKLITEEEEAFCKNFKIPELGKRDDLRSLDLVTIDGSDAKDFDDAVWAEPDPDPRNPGGYRIVVAIADVSYYVREGSILDQKARDRGNSVYFPDYVLPMLPECLSNDLCSLRPHVDRACLAADMIITKNGKLKHVHIKRALMCSKARLTYDDVEKAIHGKVNQKVEPVYHSTILPLLNAYKILRQARDERGSLDIHTKEHEIFFDKDNHVQKVEVRKNLISYQLIEEMMVLANVAVAKTLGNRDYPCMYRIHPAPDTIKVQNLKIFSKALGLPALKSDTPTPHDFNRLLEAVKGGPYDGLINDLVLRCQAQAQYSPMNQGHYGLGLTDYAHFTSPIRRYADLIVHRLLVHLFDLGEGGTKSTEGLQSIADHISQTERQAASAEREADERFLAAYLEKCVGDTFDAVIVGVNQSGLFIELSDLHAEAFVPKRVLFNLTQRVSSYFDQALHILRVGHLSFQLGMSLKVRLLEANAITCQVIAEVVLDQQATKKKDKNPSQNSKKSLQKDKKKRKFL